MASAVPIVDGRVGGSASTTDAAAFSEGYTSVFNLDFRLDGGGMGTGGKLYIGESDELVYFLFSQPRNLVDNSYGDNSIGWGDDAKSGEGKKGKNHSFKDLVGSDKAEFTFTDGQGNTTLDATFDYISEVDGTFKSGVSDGDGKVNTGDEGSVREAASSLQYNLNDSTSRTNATGIDIEEDSPGCAADGTSNGCTLSDYSDVNGNFDDWVFDINYEFSLAKAELFPNGFDPSQVTLGDVHDSPNKLGKNVVNYDCAGSTTLNPNCANVPPPPPTDVPEPSNLALFGLGLIGAAALAFRRRNRWEA